MNEANKLPGLPTHMISKVIGLYEKGKTAQEISDQLRVQVSCIQSFAPDAQPAAPARTARVRPSRAKAVDNAVDEVDKEFTSEE